VPRDDHRCAGQQAGTTSVPHVSMNRAPGCYESRPHGAPTGAVPIRQRWSPSSHCSTRFPHRTRPPADRSPSASSAPRASQRPRLACIERAQSDPSEAAHGPTTKAVNLSTQRANSAVCRLSPPAIATSSSVREPPPHLHSLFATQHGSRHSRLDIQADTVVTQGGT